MVCAPAFAAKIQASVDRNPVNLNESFQIIFNADATPDGDPDFSPLEEDFEIVSQSSSNNVSWINGTLSRSIRWTLTAMAKHAGTLQVPPISFGGDASSAVTLQVNENTGKQVAGNQQDIFVDVEATPTDPYVQAQILYTVKIYSRVDIARASINEPEQPDAVVEKLGDDKTYQTQVAGVDYVVTERRYAMFPQKSGKFTIAPLVLTAEVLAQSRSGFNGLFGSTVTRTKRASSKAITLTVRPAPASFTGRHWLAAEQLDLAEEWSGDLRNLKPGEPVTRTLTLQAKGSTVGQLPELQQAAVEESIKHYPDQPVLQEQKNADGLLAKRQEKIALIPSKPGEFKLPAIEIPWFNTRTGRMEVARIPETTLQVSAAASSTATEAGKGVAKSNVETQPTPAGQAAEAHNLWQWVSGGLAFGWLATLVFFLARKPRRAPEKAPDKAEEDLRESRQRLKKACAEHDAFAAKIALLAWGKQQFGVNSLGALATFCEARLRDEILLLNKVLYGKDAEQWHGKKLFQAFSEHKARAQWQKAKDDELEPLFRL